MVKEEDKPFSLKKADVDACSFKSWYRTFRSCTFKSELIELPVGFVNYLHNDNFTLPKEAFPKPQELDQFDQQHEKETFHSSDNENDSADDSDDDSDDEDIECHFPELEKEIKNKILLLGGNVLPKLNWSSPKVSKPIFKKSLFFFVLFATLFIGCYLDE